MTHGNGKIIIYIRDGDEPLYIYTNWLYLLSGEAGDPGGKRRAYKMAARTVYIYILYSGATMTNFESGN